MTTVKKLVKKAKKGDGEAFVTLVKQYENVLYNTAIRMLYNEDDAADALQDTIVQAYEKIHTLRHNAYFNTWIYRILLNQCNQILNKRKNLIEFNVHLHSEEAEQQEKSLTLEEALAQLSPHYKIAFTLYYIHELTTKEISEFLEEPEGTIKSRLSRGKALLRKKYYQIQEETINEKEL